MVEVSKKENSYARDSMRTFSITNLSFGVRNKINGDMKENEIGDLCNWLEYMNGQDLHKNK